MQSPTGDDDDLLPSSEVCALLFVDRSTLSRYVKAGRITPARKLAGLRGAMLFNRGDVDALAAERRVRA